MDDSKSNASDNGSSDSSQNSNDSNTSHNDMFSSMDNKDQTSEIMDIENEEEQEEDDEEEDFWTLIIRETVDSICHKRLADGHPARLSNLTDVSQLLEGQNLSAFIRRLKER